jgi:hypothetical protein
LWIQAGKSSALFLSTSRIESCEAESDGQRFIVRADEKLTAFMEVELGQTCTANRQRRKRDPLAQEDSRVRHGPT